MAYDLTAVIRLRDQITAPLRGISGQLTALVGTVGVVATAMDSLTTAMDFEAQMSKVGAIAGAVGPDLERLKDTAVQLGAETTKSASEVGVAKHTWRNVKKLALKIA